LVCGPGNHWQSHLPDRSFCYAAMTSVCRSWPLKVSAPHAPSPRAAPPTSYAPTSFYWYLKNHLLPLNYILHHNNNLQQAFYTCKSTHYSTTFSKPNQPTNHLINMSDLGRKGLGDQVQEKVTPDSQKSTLDQTKESASGLYDRAAGAVQPGKYPSHTSSSSTLQLLTRPSL